MKKSISTKFLLFIVLMASASISWGQTYYSMSSGNFSETFTGWTTPATGSWSFVGIMGTGQIPLATSTIVSSASFSSGSSGGVQNGSTNIQFLSTGTTDNSSAVALDLNLNFSARNAGTLSYDVAEVANSTGNRVASLTVYYSLNGTSWTALTGTNIPFAATNNVTSSATISISLPSAFNNQSTVKLRFYNYNGSGGTSGSRPKISLDNVSVTSTSASPTITASATLTAFTTTYGTASANQSFGISGSNLTGNITATAPTGYEVSTNGSTYATSVSYTPSSGSVSASLWVRLAATAPVTGSYNSKTIALTSTGATTVNITTASSGNAVSAAALTITGLLGVNRAYNGLTNATATGTAAYSGLVNGESFSVTGSPSFSFATATVGTVKTVTASGYTAPSTNYTLTQPTFTANITQAPLTITANAVSKNYGVTLTNPTIGSTAFTSSGLVNSETISSVTISYNHHVELATTGIAVYSNAATPSVPVGANGFLAGNYSITYNDANVTINGLPGIVASYLASFSYTCVGSTSGPNTFTITGYYLDGTGISVASSTGYTFSSDGTNYYSSLSGLTYSGDSCSITISVKFTPPSNSSYTGNIVISGGGASSVNVAPSGYGVAVPTTPGCATPAALCFGTAATITGAGSTNATTYTYWDAASSGNAITTSTTPPGTVTSGNLTTPTTLAGGTYTYYVQGENATCSSAARQAVIVTINALPANPSGTVTPAANPACASTTVSYSSPSSSTYWETSATGTSTASPTTSAFTVNTTGTTVYARTFDGTCWSSGTVNSGAITINTAQSITGNPSTGTQTVCSGTALSPSSLSVAATNATGYQWYSNTANSNTGGSLIASATSSSYSPSNTLTGTTYYYCIVSGASPCPAINSNVSGGITINTLPANPSGTISPAANPACASTTVSYSSPSSSIYWETSATGTSTASPTTSPYTVSATGTVYARAFNGTCWSSGTVNSGAITINTAPSISVQPASASAASGSGTSFSVTAANATGYQWYVNTGSGFTAISNTGVYTNATTATLNISNVAGMNGYIYQVVLSGNSPCASVTSSSATLSVTTTLWTNPITGTNPNTTNPYTTGDVKDANITVSGISRGTSIVGTNANDRYNANTWNTSSLGPNGYFQFTLTPNTNYQINFSSFTYTGQTSGTGPTSFELRSSVDGYTSAIGTPTATGTTISLTGASYQNIGSAISFRLYGWNALGSGGTFSVNDFSFTGNVVSVCSTPDAIAFVSQPTSVVQNATMGAVTVKAFCSSSGGTASTYTGAITLTASGNGCGYASQTVNAVAGIATFSNIVFTRSVQTGISLTASGSGFSNVVSNTFNVTAPAGTPSNTTVINENFDGSTPTWSYTTSATNGTSGVATIGLKDYTTNPYGNSTFKKSLVVSHTTNNAAGVGESTGQITFSNVTGLSAYNSIQVSFSVGSLPSLFAGASGNGVDANENMIVESSLDGGTTWNTVFTYYGASNYLLPLSTTSPATLAYNANAYYNANLSNVSTQSAFVINLPSGTSQFSLRVTATDNREEENWAIDNLQIIGTTIPTGAPSPLPTSSNETVSSCPITDATISTTITNAIGTVNYNWSPTTNFKTGSTASSISPIVNFASGTQVYTVTATDNDGCKATATSTVNITPSPGNVMLAPATITLQEIGCQDATGWTYYADPSDLTKWQFGIYKGGNTFTANVDINGNTSSPYDVVSNATNKKSTYTMSRYWNVTLASGSISSSSPVKVRFFYDPADLTAINTAAQTQATSWGLTSAQVHSVEWIKTNGVAYSPSNNTYSDVPNRLSASSYTTSTGTLNGISYVEYGGLTGFSGGTGGVRLSPGGYGLPVKLIYVTASAKENSYIHLDWATASEVDNSGFAVERSTNGVEFEKIGWINGNGTTTAMIHYSMDDKTVESGVIYYYRLKQTDYDGHYAYSEIISATVLAPKGIAFEDLRPNPAANLVAVNVVTQDAQASKITVTDMLGRVVLSQDWQLNAGLNGSQLDISTLSAGSYSVEVRSGSYHFSKKLVIAR